MFTIKVSVKGKEYLEALATKIKATPQHVTQYLYWNIYTVLDYLDKTVVNNVIYGAGGVTKRTGALGKTFSTYAQMVNQYSFHVIGSFSGKIPYIPTQVGEGYMTIKAKEEGKFLWIPKPGGPADVYPRRPVSDFYDAYKKRLKDVYCFVPVVTIKQRVSPTEVQNSFYEVLGRKLPSLAMKALDNWKKVNGY